jgi:hypothetical protein
VRAAGGQAVACVYYFDERQGKPGRLVSRDEAEDVAARIVTLADGQRRRHRQLQQQSSPPPSRRGRGRGRRTLSLVKRPAGAARLNSSFACSGTPRWGFGPARCA